jgi:hypothetical protein
MPTKTSVPSNSRSKRKPTHAHSSPDADGVQNEIAERDEASRIAILANSGLAVACRVLLKQHFAQCLAEMKWQYIWSVRWYGLIEKV